MNKDNHFEQKKLGLYKIMQIDLKNLIINYEHVLKIHRNIFLIMFQFKIN